MSKLLSPSLDSPDVVLSTAGLTVTFGESDVGVKDVSLDVERGEILGIIGPSGSGKSTFLNALNKMLKGDYQIEGVVTVDGVDVYREYSDEVELRQLFGRVAQKAQPFPHMEMYKDVTYPAVLRGIIPNRKSDRLELAQELLKKVGLWDEVKDRYMRDSGISLSGDQQQRLCIARAIAADPKILIMDEPCSALDPKATALVETLMQQLRSQGYTIMLVTHSMGQAARVADRTACFWDGELIEINRTELFFTNPQDDRVEALITGRVG